MVVHCRGIFFAPAAAELGVDVTLYATYTAVAGMAGVLSLPLVQKLFSRFPLKPLMLCYLLLFFGSEVGMGLAQEMWQCYLMGAIQGLFCSFLTLYPVAYLLKNWFDKYRGTVTGIATMCAGLVSVGMNLVLATAITRLGWRVSYVLVGVGGFLIAALPWLLFAVRSPEELGMTPYGKENGVLYKERVPQTKETVRLRGKLLQNFLPIGFVTVALYMASGYVQHLANYANDLGYSSTQGAALISVCMAGNVISKLLSGVLNDRIGPYKTSIISLGTMAAAMVILCLQPRNLPLLYLAAFFLGQATSFIVVQIPLLLGSGSITDGAYEACMGAVVMIGALTGAIHNLLIPLFYGLSNSYTVGFGFVASMFFISIYCILLFRKQRAMSV